MSDQSLTPNPLPRKIAEVAASESADTHVVVMQRIEQRPLALPAPKPKKPRKEKPAPTGNWEDRIIRNNDGAPLNTVANVMTIIGGDAHWLGVLAFNEFTGEVETLKAPPMRSFDRPSSYTSGHWTDDDTTYAQAWFRGSYGFEPSPDKIERAVSAIAKRVSFHPVREWLQSLKWDGTARLDKWLTRYLGAEQSFYMTAIGPKILIGMVARVMRPGCKLDTMPILESDQGARKSTAIETLVSVEWFADTALEIGDKDSRQGLRGKWGIELAELDSIKSARSVGRIKNFLSQRNDHFRPPYGRRFTEVPRQCVFWGTVNPDGGGYLVDQTGNRRFWPITCGTIDLEALKADRDQLFAEACARFNAGERWWLSTEEEAAAFPEQDSRTEEDAWEAPIAKWLERPHKPDPASPFGDRIYMLPSSGVTTSDVLSYALDLPASHHGRKEAGRVGVILRAYGWTTKGKARPRRYFPPEPAAEKSEEEAA